MATEQIRWDDLDFRQDPPVRTPATETVTFSFGDSGTLALDLNADHAKEITEMIAAWMEAATPVQAPAKTTRARRTNSSASTASTADRTPAFLKDFRAWAAEQGHPVEQYTRAGGKPGAYKYDPDQIAEYDAFLVNASK
jgi:hypothetical protein